MTFYPYCGAERPDAFHDYQRFSDPERRIDAAIRALAPFAGRLVLDIGAGNGFHSHRFAAEAARVIAVEPDPRMRAQARELCAAAAPDERFEILPGDAEDIPLPDASVDLVHARYAYFFGSEACLPGLAEVRRVLRPGGCFVVIDSTSDGTFGRIYRRYFPQVFEREAEMLAFWRDHGFSHQRVATEWRAPDRAQMAAALALEHPPEQIAEILAAVPGTGLDYAVHLFHWRKPERPPAPVPSAVCARLGVEMVQTADDDPVTNNNGQTLAVELVRSGEIQPAIVKTLPHGLSEVPAWTALSDRGAPIPTLLAHWRDELQREVLLLERLGPHRLDGRSPRDFAAMVTTLARFNGATAPTLPAGPRNRVHGWSQDLRRLWERCRGGDWGAEPARAAAVLDGRWDAVDAYARSLDAQLADLPWVPTHHDPAFGNWGRRAADDALLLFDLGYTDRAPVGRDLALLLGGFRQARPADSETEPWLARWREHAGLAIAADELARAVALWRAAQVLWMDARTIAQAQRAWLMDRERFTGAWAPWYADSWSELARIDTSDED